MSGAKTGAIKHVGKIAQTANVMWLKFLCSAVKRKSVMELKQYWASEALVLHESWSSKIAPKSVHKWAEFFEASFLNFSQLLHPEPWWGRQPRWRWISCYVIRDHNKDNEASKTPSHISNDIKVMAWNPEKIVISSGETQMIPRSLEDSCMAQNSTVSPDDGLKMWTIYTSNKAPLMLSQRDLHQSIQQ